VSVDVRVADCVAVRLGLTVLVLAAVQKGDGETLGKAGKLQGPVKHTGCHAVAFGVDELDK
jgi:hypothetical protein